MMWRYRVDASAEAEDCILRDDDDDTHENTNEWRRFDCGKPLAKHLV